MAKPPEYWTNDEIRQLTLHYGKVTPAELSQRLGRTTRAVKNKAYSLGITAKECRPWSKKDEKRLLEMYKCEPIPVIAAALKRTEYAILHRLRVLAGREVTH